MLEMERVKGASEAIEISPSITLVDDTDIGCYITDLRGNSICHNNYTKI